MSEKTIKHEIYKHGSYLYSLKETGSKFVNIDDEIKKFDELFELASKNREVITVVGSGGHVNAHKLIQELQPERTE